MDQQHTHEEPNYMAVFYALIVLTLIELWAANQTAMFGRQGVMFILVSLAFIKAAMVALWYMHLKFERWILYLVSAVPMVLICVLLSGSITDVGRPHELEPLFGPPYPRTHQTDMQKGIVAPNAPHDAATPAHDAGAK